MVSSLTGTIAASSAIDSRVRVAMRDGGANADAPSASARIAETRMVSGARGGGERRCDYSLQKEDFFKQNKREGNEKRAGP